LWELTVFHVFLLDWRRGQHFSEKCSSISIRLLSPAGYFGAVMLDSVSTSWRTFSAILQLMAAWKPNLPFGKVLGQVEKNWRSVLRCFRSGSMTRRQTLARKSAVSWAQVIAASPFLRVRLSPHRALVNRTALRFARAASIPRAE